MSHDSTPSIPRLLTAAQAARCLGFTKSTIYDWLARGYLPYHRLGNRLIRISASDLDAFITKSRINEERFPGTLEAQHELGVSGRSPGGGFRP
ncbi:MAG: helix-turn-helix domain-containing protein [Patescibacteria group bacterium]